MFQQIMMETGMAKLQDQLKFLRTVPLLATMSEDQLLKLSDAFEVVSESSTTSMEELKEAAETMDTFAARMEAIFEVVDS